MTVFHSTDTLSFCFECIEGTIFFSPKRYTFFYIDNCLVSAFSFHLHRLYRLKHRTPLTMSEGVATFEAPLSQGFGYGIILGLGFAFALVMIFITWALKRLAVPL